MAVSTVPAGYHTVTPYLYVRDCVAAIAFYEKAFGATELFRLPMPGGGIAHAEIKIGDTPLMMSDEMPQWGNRSPLTLNGTTVGLMLTVPDVDEAFARAVQAGAKVMRPVADQFYGDRSGTLVDPFGHVWTVATHIEDVPLDEMKSRMETWMASQKS